MVVVIHVLLVQQAMLKNLLIQLQPVADLTCHAKDVLERVIRRLRQKPNHVEITVQADAHLAQDRVEECVVTVTMGVDLTVEIRQITMTAG